MGFKLKKVITEDRDNVRQSLADTVLLMASLLHDSIESDNEEESKNNFNMLVGSINLLGNDLFKNDK